MHHDAFYYHRCLKAKFKEGQNKILRQLCIVYIILCLIITKKIFTLNRNFFFNPLGKNKFYFPFIFIFFQNH